MKLNIKDASIHVINTRTFKLMSPEYERIIILSQELIDIAEGRAENRQIDTFIEKTKELQKAVLKLNNQCLTISFED